jgi:hypothetical protein
MNDAIRAPSSSPLIQPSSGGSEATVGVTSRSNAEPPCAADAHHIDIRRTHAPSHSRASR